MGRPAWRTDAETVLRILEARKSTSVPVLARRFDLAEVTIRKIISGDRWAYVSKEIDAKRKELTEFLEKERLKRTGPAVFDAKHYRTHISAFGRPTACGVHNYTLGVKIVENIESVTCSNCLKRLREKRNQYG